MVRAYQIAKYLMMLTTTTKTMIMMHDSDVDDEVGNDEEWET